MMMIMRGKYLLAGIVASTLLLGACDLNIHLPGGNNDSLEDKQKTEKNDNKNKTPNNSNKNNDAIRKKSLNIFLKNNRIKYYLLYIHNLTNKKINLKKIIKK